MEELFLQLNEDILCTLNELDLSKVYLFQIEVGDMPIEAVKHLLEGFKTKCEELGIKAIYSATHDGVAAVNVIELKQYLENNNEGEDK